MLGMLGDCFAERSATAFSVALVTGLAGNMLINYLMGLIAKAYGIGHVTTVISVEILFMVILGIFIFRSMRTANKPVINLISESEMPS